jgi:uncharacterized protein with GYD domain
MAKYLIQATYTEAGGKGILKEGGTARRAAIEQALGALGGKMEACYFAFGDVDIYVVVDLPDNTTAVAASLIANIAGTAKTKYTVLVTPEEVDRAAQIGRELGRSYRPPGQ